MSFNIGLSGLRAANKRLEVTGNNIANAGTAGFKASRADFADVYSGARYGSGSNAVGSGVRLAAVSQNFRQGSISGASGNVLDMGIQGQGFFVLNDKGALSYTRAGAFYELRQQHTEQNSCA
jgi:flagellar hook protein FlgE